MTTRNQRWTVGFIATAWAIAMAATAQQPAAQAPAAVPATQATAAGFSKEQLEQIVAPMALYPDPVVSLMLMASTYPLEIVQAARWVRANPGLKDKALEEGLKQHDWDASVKSMTGFPDVLKQMDENLDWTQDLGDAFLAQKTELMDTIQRMRGKAYDSGNLKTTEQQVSRSSPTRSSWSSPPTRRSSTCRPTPRRWFTAAGPILTTTTRRCTSLRPTATARWRSQWA
jgi:hypothetical protein